MSISLGKFIKIKKIKLFRTKVRDVQAQQLLFRKHTSVEHLRSFRVFKTIPSYAYKPFDSKYLFNNNFDILHINGTYH